MGDGCRIAARSTTMTPHLYHLDWLSQQAALRAERSRPYLTAQVYRSGARRVIGRLLTLVHRRGAHRLADGRPESASTTSAFPSGVN
jgi:hypothetical protein